MCLVYTALVSCDQCNAVTQFKIMVDKTANKIECQDCMICPPGEEAHPPCESSIIHFVPVNQSCGRCHEGYFKSQPNEFQCNQCKICVKGQPYVQNCTAEKDAECSTACIYGMYMGKDWHCHPCCPCHSGENLFEFQCASFPGKVSEEIIFMLKMGDHGRSDFYVVFTMSLCALGLKQLLISLLFQIIWL